ncbi:MAG: T9SS type A sorting domain-containing protein [Lewinellaceae bacterium]|nr:T9SS type A sorting domain-containing protein [Lewinellaceae bacterium]
MKNIYFTLLSFTFLLFAGFAHVEAQSNQYLHFDRVDDYVEVPGGSQYIQGLDKFSMAGWFYTDQLAYGQGMMGIRGGGSGEGGFYLIQLTDGVIESRLITTAGFHEFVAPAFSIVPQVWQHLAWVYNGSKVELFINGNSVGSASASGTFPVSNKPFAIGKSIQGGFNFVFGGRVDEVSLWSKALTQPEIQDMMDNELAGTESGLELYYKFNQGVPGEDNTAISKLVSETGNGTRDGNLINFALTGDISNFGGTFDPGFQAITFPQIPNKLTTDGPFQLQATASSGLPVSYEVLSGPATIDGDVVTLTGEAGEVRIKASQEGDGTFNPAADLVNIFQVLDPQGFVPVIDARSPLAGDVFVPILRPIQLAVITSIDYPELFSVSDVKIEIGAEEIALKDWGNEHYTAWWTPPGYGSYTMNIISTNNYGASATESVTFNVAEQAQDVEVTATNQVWAYSDVPSQTVEAELPSYLGAFDNITAVLAIDCPDGGCDPWDRISSIDAKGHNGEWYEIIRYITPYGVACGHTVDLTDFMSILQGKIAFRVNLGTQGNGFLYTLALNYQAGPVEHPYSHIQDLWRDEYPFGDPSNLQPCEVIETSFPDYTQAAKIKLVATGHGWGDNNTGNAAEFHEDIHHIWVNGEQTFEHHNWNDCNPNPDGCQPQNGTWFYNRAGWCPGTIAPWFDYDMTGYIGQGPLELKYIFDEDYIDNCHPNNPDCVSGVTCPDCNDGFNPVLLTSSYLISRGDQPLDGTFVTDVEGPLVRQESLFTVFPNPSSGNVNLELKKTVREVEILVYNGLGQVAYRLSDMEQPGALHTLLLGNQPKGVYVVEVRTDAGIGRQKVVIE